MALNNINTHTPPAASPSCCRSCGATLTTEFLDLGATPLANSLLHTSDLLKPEQHVPLRVLVCEACFLVQLDDYVSPEDIFTDYVYFSSYSESWLAHAREYVECVSTRFGISPSSFVVEIASNDGYLLKNFVAREVPCLGIEPATNVAAVARKAGIPTENMFFGSATASDLVARHCNADLVVANNVLAHVPNLNDFISGLSHLLSRNGVITIEAPHFLKLLEEAQFDTIYHEHFSYLSLIAVEEAMKRHGLEVFDVEELPTHGGSLRYYISNAGQHSRSALVVEIVTREKNAGLDRPESYTGFKEHVRRIKLDLLAFLTEAARTGHKVACYGAAAKGNTMLNYCGIDGDLVAFAVDRNPEKQGRYLPGSRIPVRSPEAVQEEKPDYLLILPWNLKDEIMEQMADIRDWGGQFVWAVPELVIAP